MSKDQRTNAQGSGLEQQTRGDVGQQVERGVSNAATADTLLDCVVVQQGNRVSIQAASEPNPPASSHAEGESTGSQSSDQPSS
jgi:hypothetical protein